MRIAVACIRCWLGQRAGVMNVLGGMTAIRGAPERMVYEFAWRDRIVGDEVKRHEKPRPMQLVRDEEME